MLNFSKLAALAKTTSKSKTALASSLDELAQEKMTRRAALRRIGMTGAMTVLGALTIDDLARVATQKLEQNEMTRGIAKDFKSAGVAFADTIGDSPSPYAVPASLPKPTDEAKLYNPPECCGEDADCNACQDAQEKHCRETRGNTLGAAGCRLVAYKCQNLCNAEGGVSGGRMALCWAAGGRQPYKPGPNPLPGGPPMPG